MSLWTQISFALQRGYANPLIDKLPDIIITLFENSSSSYHCFLAPCHVTVDACQRLSCFHISFFILPMQIREIIIPVYQVGDVFHLKQKERYFYFGKSWMKTSLLGELAVVLSFFCGGGGLWLYLFNKSQASSLWRSSGKTTWLQLRFQDRQERVQQFPKLSV